MLTLFLMMGLTATEPKTGLPELKVDTVNAFFVKGIAKKPGKTNRVYTVGALEDEFGKPAKRISSQGLTRVKTSVQREEWIYDCLDGHVTVTFILRGYGSLNSPKSLRLQIFSVSVKRA
jgi:hypothetical protein